MSSSKSRYLAVSSGHVDALISYVLDAKPYHTKLSEIVERYDLDDTVNVRITEDHRLVAFLGADLMEANSTSFGIRSKRSNSWMKDLTADGSRRTWPVPMTSVHKLFSHSNQEKFTAGVHDNFQIPGIQNSAAKAFNPRRWDGPSIANVRKQGSHQQESYDYYLSHGAYSFDVTPGERWKEHNLVNITQFAEHNGVLHYNDVVKPFGTILDIERGAYDEWTLTCINETTQTLSVVGQYNGAIGQVSFGGTFDHPLLKFTFGPAPDEVDSFVSVGDTFVLSPFHKVTVGPAAIPQTWSVIKVNPIGLTSKPIFTSANTPEALSRLFTPYVEINTRSIDRNTAQTVWRIVFTSPTTYTVQKTAVGGSYTIPGVQLVDGCAFKNDDIHFTVYPTLEGFVAGDAFDFVVGARIENFLVYGSVSGWQANAKQGEWYWNGQIGFKIPKLEYFAEVFTSAIFLSEDASQEGWKPALTSESTFKSIMYDDGFYALGENNEVQFSDNGYIWTTDLPTRTSTNRMIFVKRDGGDILLSTDGQNWQEIATGTDEQLNDILTYTKPSTSIVASYVVGDRGTIARSVDGVNWVLQTSGTLQNLNGVTRRNNRVVVCGDAGFVAYSNDDGTTWNTVSIPNAVFGSLSQADVDFTDIKHVAPSGLFVMSGSKGVILTSPDGLTWTRPQFGWDGANRDTGTFSYVAHSSTHIIVTSIEGWVATSPIAATGWSRYFDVRLKSIVFGDDKFVALGATAIPLNLFFEVQPVHSMAEPSVYTIEFQPPIVPGDPVRYATVKNNIYGYRGGLTVNEVWRDEFCSFRLEDIPGEFEYEAGDTIKVYLAPEYVYGAEGWYDEYDYELPLYDTGVVDRVVPWLYNEEYYPLYHGHGLVIFKSGIVDGDRVIIDKALTDVVRLRIKNSDLLYPELASTNDWIPLEFRYFDNTGSTATNYTGSLAHFPDLTTTIEAYLASDPTVKAFTLRQPRYMCSNRNASSTFILDEAFASRFLPVNTAFTIRVHPDSNYGQKLRVKITENLRAYARVRLIFDDVMTINVADALITTVHLDLTDTATISMIEAGALPIAYDEGLYDVGMYDVRAVIIPQAVEIAPGVYDYTEDPADWIMPKPTPGAPGVYVEDRSVDVAGTHFVEGLTITSTSLTNEVDYHVVYDFDTVPVAGQVITADADRYVVTVSEALLSAPDVYVESMDALTGALVPISMTPIANSTVTSNTAFSFQMPLNGSMLPILTAPFRLRIVQ